MAADAAELVDAAGCADYRPILDDHVAGEGHGVGKHGVTADSDVVGHVDIGHQEIVVADGGDHSAAFGAAVDSDEFADLVAMADSGLGTLAVILQILRRDADGRVGKKMLSSPI